MDNIKHISLTTEEHYKRLFYDFDNLYSKIPISKINIDLIKNNERFKKNNVHTILQEFNKNNYRCDNFIKKHNGKHLLFAGDSYAFGCGVSIEDTWTKIVYNKINIDEKCSGYFNLGMLANSVPNCYSDIFKYCSSYGNPDAIFVSLADTAKFYYYDKEENIVADAVYDKESYKVFSIIQYQMYLMLDQYCKSNNIKLIAVSPADIDKDLTKVVLGNEIRQFESFLELDKNESETFMTNFIKINNVNYYAKDKSHMGLAFHTYLANKMYEKYISVME